MGKANKAIDAFIDDISDDHLTNLKSKSGTITKDIDFRLDMQGLRQNRRTQSTQNYSWTNSRIVHDRIDTLQPPDSNQQWDCDQYAGQGDGQDCDHGLSLCRRGMECCRNSSQIQRKLINLRENLQDRVGRMKGVRRDSGKGARNVANGCVENEVIPQLKRLRTSEWRFLIVYIVRPHARSLRG